MKKITNSAYKTNPTKDKQRKIIFLPAEEWWPT
jgi:hypothetical protein